MLNEAVKIKPASLNGSFKMPSRATPGSSGYDICACLDDDVVIEPGGRAAIPAGFSISMPAGTEAQIRPRSGMALKHGVTVLNAPGTVDSDYRGEVKIILINHGEENYTVKNGARIAQMVICEISGRGLKIAAVLDGSERGKGGFGHTGTGEEE